MAQAVSRQPVNAESRVGFMVDKVALGHVFVRVLRLSPVNIIPPSLSVLIYHLEDEQYAR
jgi:hypothetical protein